MKRIRKLIVGILIALSLFACSKEEVILEGNQGDELATMFFNFKVNEAYFIDHIEDTITKEGYQFLVVDITVRNDKEEAVEMADTDFYVQWNEEKYDALSSYGTDPLLEGELSSSYMVDPDGEVNGKMIFVVPQDADTLTFHTQDHYRTGEDEEITDGDIYTITLNPIVQSEESE